MAIKGLSLAVLLFAGLFGFSSFSDSSPTIIWEPKKITTEVFQGGGRTFNIEFKSNQDITDVEVVVPTKLQQFITAEPNALSSITAGETQIINLSIIIPTTTSLKKFSGNIKLRGFATKKIDDENDDDNDDNGNEDKDDDDKDKKKKLRKFSKPLKVKFKVISPQVVEDAIAEFLIQELGTTTPIIPPDRKFLFATTTPGLENLLSERSNLPAVFKSGSITFLGNLFSDFEVFGAVDDLIPLAFNEGIRMIDIKSAHQSLIHGWSREDPGKPLIPVIADATTFLPGLTLHDVSGDGKVDHYVFVPLLLTHTILKSSDADEIVARDFTAPTGIAESAATALHELVHVFNFRTECGGGREFYDSQAEEDFVSERIEPLIKAVFSNASPFFLNASVDAALNFFPNTQNCLERLDLTRPTPVVLNTPFDISTSTISLSWSQNTDMDFESYKIFRDTNPAVDTNDTLVASITDVGQTFFTDSGLSSGTTFFYKVFAFDKAGLSSESNEVSATTLSLIPPISCPFSGVITSDARIPLSESPCVVQGAVTVASGATLTIDPGVTLKFDGILSRIIFDGNLEANGTISQPINLTSIKDDAVDGNDTNNDGMATTPAPGDWRGLVFNSGSVSTLTHSNVSFGGSFFFPIFPAGANIALQGGDLTVASSNINNSGLDNILISSGNFNVSLSDIDFAPRSGVRQTGGNVIIVDSTFNNNGDAVFSESGVLNLIGNTFTDNGSAANLLASTFFTHNSNTAFNNNINGFRIAGVFTQDQTWNADLPYVATSTVTIASGATLTLEPGVVVKFGNLLSRMIVDGTLNANGSAGQPIFFTSIKDDTVPTTNGDTNNDGILTSPSPGNWRNLVFNAGSVSILQNASIRYGGSGFFPVFPAGVAVAVEGGDLDFVSSHASFSASDNIRITSGSIKVLSSEIDNATQGLSITGGTVAISQSSIHDNSLFGIINSTPPTIIAENNFWGDSSGPFHPTFNPGGLGDVVSNNVDFIPFLTSDPVGGLP